MDTIASILFHPTIQNPIFSAYGCSWRISTNSLPHFQPITERTVSLMVENVEAQISRKSLQHTSGTYFYRQAEEEKNMGVP